MFRRAFNSSALHKRRHCTYANLNFSKSVSGACTAIPKFSAFSISDIPVAANISQGQTSQMRLYHSTRITTSPTLFSNHKIPMITLGSTNLILAPMRSNFTSNDVRRLISSESKNEFKPDTATTDWIGKGRINPKFLGIVGLTTAAAVYFISPEAIDQMKKSSREYDEIDPEDDMYLQMKEVSHEIRGEIARKIFGKELTEMVDAENKAAGNTADVVADVLNSDALQNAIASLITRVLGSAQLQVACQALLKNLWTDLVNDPETLSQIVALLNTAIKDEQIKKSFKELVLGLLQDEEVYNELTGLVVRLGEDKEVLAATKELLTESAHQALNDPEVLDHSMEFAADIVGDNVIQRTSGEALRNTVTYAVRPSLSTCKYCALYPTTSDVYNICVFVALMLQFNSTNAPLFLIITVLSVFGVALLFISASALGQARMVSREGKQTDAATSLVAQNIVANVWKRILEIGSLPANTVAAIGAAIANVFLVPVGMMGNIVLSISKAGGKILNAVQTFVANIIASPRMAVSIVRNSLLALRDSSMQHVASSISYMASIPELIILNTRGSLVFIVNIARAKAASVGNVLCSSITFQFVEFIEFSKAGCASGMIRCSNSFGIMLNNTVAQGKLQLYRFRDTSGFLVTNILSVALGLFGYLSQSDVE